MGDFVFGRPLSGSTLDAINIKQRLLGERYDTETIALARHYFNSRSPWVRLSSGVRIYDLEKAEYFGVQLGNQLAKENILTAFDEFENSAVLDSTLSDYYGGFHSVGRSSTIGGTVSYDEFGPRPRPGITNVSTTVHGMYGSLKTTTVNFKCWTPLQLDILDVLYMRPGYTVVLEMGYSHYVRESESGFYEINDDIVPIDIFSDTYISEESNNFNKIYKDIVKKRAQYVGAYEGVVGVVKNFVWSLQPDGSYNCTVDIVSKGELIDSLVASIGKGSIEEKNPEPTEVHRQLRKLHNFDDKVTFTAESTKRGEGAWHYIAEDYFKALVDKPESSKYIDRRFSYVYKQRFDISEEMQTYVTFALLNSVLNKYMVKQGTGTAEDSYLSLDTDFIDKRYYTSNLHLSINPLICLLPKSTESGGVFPDIKIQPRPLQPQDSLSVGEILLNVDYVLDTLTKNLDEKGALKLQEFFFALFSGIEKATGGLNHFDLHSDDNSTLYILDRRDIGESAVPESNIEIYGLSSIVKSLNLASKLSPKLSTMVAISAQNEPSKLGIEATSFRVLNRGVEDSISLRRVASAETSQEFEFIEQEGTAEVTVKLTDTLKSIRKGITNIYVNKGSVEDNYKEIFSGYSGLLHNSFESVKTPQASFAIPFELLLTLDGTAGFVVGETFTISGDILPITYKRILERSNGVKTISQDTKVGFIITGVEQQLSKGEWNTVVRSQIYLSAGKDVVRKTYKISLVDDRATPATAEEITEPTTSATPNADTLREVLRELGYTEKGRELSNGGDITLELARVSEELFEDLKTTFPAASLRVTGGNDTYHQRLSYNSKHREGKGLDFVVDAPPNLVTPISKFLNDFANRDSRVTFLDEYKKQSKAASGQHFHIEIA